MTRAFGLTIRKMFIDNKRIFIRFIVSLTVCIALIGVLCSVTAFAADNNASGNAGTTSAITDTTSGNTSGGTESASSSVMKDLIGVDGSQSLEVILLVTVLSLAPSLLVMMTSFARIIICFSFLRTAMQTQSTPPNMVLTGLSLFLTIFIMWPVFSEINETAYQPYAAGEMTMEQAIDAAGKPLKTFMLKQTTNDDMKFFLDLKGQSMSDVTGGATDNITLENYSAETCVPDGLSDIHTVPCYRPCSIVDAYGNGYDDAAAGDDFAAVQDNTFRACRRLAADGRNDCQLV